jgi:hypothetical protein
MAKAISHRQYSAPDAIRCVAWKCRRSWILKQDTPWGVYVPGAMGFKEEILKRQL